MIVSLNNLDLFLLLYTQTNTFQAIVITNGYQSYAVLIYNCDQMDWSGNAVIGFKADDDSFQNHPFSGSNASFVACQNSPDHTWSNVIYQLRKMTVIIVHFQCNGV